MRNLFDQYTRPENRLTHALAVCLSEDRRLLASWFKWIGLRPPKPATKLDLVEQRVPGEHEPRESEPDDRGLPDIVIHDNAGWCVFIESKVEAALINTRKALDIILNGWVAMKPVLEALTEIEGS